MSRLSGSQLVSFSSPSAWNALTDTTIENTTVNVPGCKVGDFVFVSTEAGDVAEYTLSGRIATDGVVTVIVHPDGGGGGMNTGTTCYVKTVSREAL